VRGSGVAAAHVVAFWRAGRAITVATRLPGGLRRASGWRDTVLPLAPGRWHDVLTGSEHNAAPDGLPGSAGGSLRLANVLTRLPVALLVWRDDDLANDKRGPGERQAG
jgi:(1->4)-alpha-D-glucan 1-alpha-D-glucosylmutase